MGGAVPPFPMAWTGTVLPPMWIFRICLPAFLRCVVRFTLRSMTGKWSIQGRMYSAFHLQCVDAHNSFKNKTKVSSLLGRAPVSLGKWFLTFEGTSPVPAQTSKWKRPVPSKCLEPLDNRTQRHFLDYTAVRTSKLWSGTTFLRYSQTLKRRVSCIFQYWIYLHFRGARVVMLCDCQIK